MEIRLNKPCWWRMDGAQGSLTALNWRLNKIRFFITLKPNTYVSSNPLFAPTRQKKIRYLALECFFSLTNSVTVSCFARRSQPAAICPELQTFGEPGQVGAQWFHNPLLGVVTTKAGNIRCTILSTYDTDRVPTCPPCCPGLRAPVGCVAS